MVEVEYVKYYIVSYVDTSSVGPDKQKSAVSAVRIGPKPICIKEERTKLPTFCCCNLFFNFGECLKKKKKKLSREKVKF